MQIKQNLLHPRRVNHIRHQLLEIRYHVHTLLPILCHLAKLLEPRCLTQIFKKIQHFLLVNTLLTVNQ